MENDKSKTVTTSSKLSSEEQPPMRSVFCVKSRKRAREMEMVDDCFILDYNPYETLDFSSLSKSGDGDIDTPLTVLAEKGHVACRDFPHSRHQCVTYPFSKTPNERHCKQCYCYVCDVSAPCAEDRCTVVQVTKDRAVGFIFAGRERDETLTQTQTQDMGTDKFTNRGSDKPQSLYFGDRISVFLEALKPHCKSEGMSLR